MYEYLTDSELERRVYMEPDNAQAAKELEARVAEAAQRAEDEHTRPLLDPYQ